MFKRNNSFLRYFYAICTYVKILVQILNGSLLNFPLNGKLKKCQNSGTLTYYQDSKFRLANANRQILQVLVTHGIIAKALRQGIEII
jgi:hypothetical protein